MTTTEVRSATVRAARKPIGAVPGWLVACSVYLLAVLHRTSLGVAGLQAAHRFHIGASELSVFVLLQLGIYAALQIPAGVLVDRIGPRRMLLAASSLMAVAQFGFAFAHSYPEALAARALLGAGDAMTFVSVLRYAVTRFSPRRYPVVVALTATIGTVGNMVATLPLSLALHRFGWTPSFAVCALISVVTGVAVWLLLPASTPLRAASNSLRVSHPLRSVRAPLARMRTDVRAAWATPGTRTGFWIHFACMSATTTFGVLWGLPYLVTAVGLSQAAASGVLLVGVGSAAVAGPLMGALIARRPPVRTPIAVVTCLLTVAGWLVLLAPSRPSRELVVVLVAVMALGGPASSIGFALARDYNPARVVGTATGVVNVGGFLATVICALGVGGVLDALGSTPHGFRMAMLVLVGVQVLGTVQTVRWWRRNRAFVLTRQANGHEIPVAVSRRFWDVADYAPHSAPVPDRRAG